MAITAAQRLITVVLASLVLVPLGGAADTRGQVFPGKAGRLVFQSNRDGSYDLYVAATDGSNQRKLLAKPDTDEFNPGWSPTGTRLVFQTGPQDASNFDIWTINSSGKGARPVVTGATNDRAPQWCDQSTIVFSRRISATSSDVWRVEANGKVLRRLTSYPGIESSPTCRPNTDRLAFISDRDGQPRIYELRLNGAGLRPLTDAPSLDPDYAPDGSTIAYVAPDTDGNLEVFTKNLRSGQIVQRTHTSRPYEYRLPKFAPNYRALMGLKAQAPDEIVATKRNTDTGSETVEALTGGTSETVEEPGSGGVYEPLIEVPYCGCSSFDVSLNPSVLYTKFKSEKGLTLTAYLDWKLTCRKGGRGCNADIFINQLSTGAEVKNTTYVYCTGQCNNTRTGRQSLLITGNKRYGWSRRGIGPGTYLVIKYTTLCGSGDTTRQFVLAFARGTQNIDYDESDLNGDGKPDGA